eukprot:COSAG02_NODE_2342_length_9101_cov_78.830038_4_plen_46_part_00
MREELVLELELELEPELELGLGLDEQHQQLAYLADEPEEGPPPLT